MAHFGDLMAPKKNSNGLTTTVEVSDLSPFSPLERILITANGNLQRIVSSYHAKTVQIKLVYNNEIETGCFHRQVTLHLDHSETPFCRATSKVTIQNEKMLRAIASNKIGIGQLFRHFDTLPVFTLLAVRRGTCDSAKNIVHGTQVLPPVNPLDLGHVGDPFWRLYRLEAAAGVDCLIHEQFERSVL
jgi:hypothetical protein